MVSRLIYLSLLLVHVLSDLADSEIAKNVVQEEAQFEPEVDAHTLKDNVDDNEEFDDNVEDGMDERNLQEELEPDEHAFNDDEVEDNEVDDDDGHIEGGVLSEGPDDDLENDMDERSLRRIPRFCWRKEVPKDGLGRLIMKEAKKCRQCRDRVNTFCNHRKWVVHGEFCKPQCRKGFHPSVNKVQCLNGRFQGWRCPRNHVERRHVVRTHAVRTHAVRTRTHVVRNRHHGHHWQWCPRDHQKHAPFCVHSNTKSYDCDPRKCCWKRGRGCLMKHFSSSSSVGAVILWVLLALLLLAGGGFGGWFVLKANKRKNKGEAVEESDDE